MTEASLHPAPDKAPIFVVGTGRSGSTLLRQLLNAHPRIYLTMEASYYSTLPYFSKRKNGSDWFDWFSQLRVPFFNYAYLYLRKSEVRAEIGEAVPRERIKDIISAIMRCKARHYNRPRYGDKTPYHTNHLKEIFNDFPDARVIHIVRDPRAMVASYLRMPWGVNSVLLCNYLIRRQLRKVRKFSSRVYELKLEDLLKDPRKEMKGVLDFVGEDWDEAVLDHSNNAPSDDMPPYPWLQTAVLKPYTRKRPRWLEQLSPVLIRLIERQLSVEMARHDYEIVPLDREPGILDYLKLIVRDLPKSIGWILRYVIWAYKGIGFKTSDKEIQDRFLSLNPGAMSRHYPGFVPPTPPKVMD